MRMCVKPNMPHDNRGFKQNIIDQLMNATGDKTPTSSLGRLGRMASTVLRSGSVSVRRNRRAKKGDPTEIDAAQLAKIVRSVGRLKGIAMKMGQIMSYIDMALPDELRDALSVLQTHAQPMPFERVRELVEKELGANGKRLAERMERQPIAAASIGQVHRAELPDGQVVAVKIQYPEIANAIEADFAPAAIGTKIATLFYPNARMDSMIAEARARFLEECDYLHEARAGQRFFEIYENHPTLFVPPVHLNFCSKRVLTTSFVDGLEFEQFLLQNPSPVVRNRLGAALFEFYLGTLFRENLYNCDPHPGNYLFLSDGRIAMLDHGCTREFSSEFVGKLASLTRAMHLDERSAIHRALVSLDMVRDDQSYDYETIRGFLQSFYGPMLIDETCKIDLSAAMEMREVFRSKQKLMKFSLPGEFLFLFRIRFGLMSVLTKLGAELNWFAVEKGYIEEFIKRQNLPKLE